MSEIGFLLPRVRELEAENERLRLAAVRAEEALRQACAVIRGLADQQAMQDDWYLAPLAEFEALAAAGADTEPDDG